MTAVEILYLASHVLLLVSALVILARAVRGPSIFDRLLALETLALGVVGYLLLQANARDARLYLDAAMGMALFSFVGTVVFARFAGRGELSDE